MKISAISLGAVCGFALLGMGAAMAQAPAAAVDGKAIYDARCKMCHEGGSAPDAEKLGAMKAEEIVAALTDGIMAPMASGMSDEDKKAVAKYLTEPKTTAQTPRG